MSAAALEHINITSMDAERTADALCSMFGWRVRWQGPSAIGGESIHVGTDDAYVAIYSPPEGQRTPGRAAAAMTRGAVDSVWDVERRWPARDSGGVLGRPGDRAHSAIAAVFGTGVP